MPRQARKESGTGIYHVMMRGINHQNNRNYDVTDLSLWHLLKKPNEEK